jgi:hypothetical protein
MDRSLLTSDVCRDCPIAGEGVNRWLFRAARKLHVLKVEPEKIEELLEEATADCGRNLRRDEIPRAVRNSTPGLRPTHRLYRQWPLRNYEQIEAIGLNGFRAAGLQANSPIQLDDTENQTEAIIDALFPGNPLLCAGASVWHAETRTREEWRRHLSQQQFIVPSPMSKLRGITAEGKSSAHSLDNTGPRQFLVIEFDFAEKHKNGRETAAAPLLRRLAKNGVAVADLCAALHAELAKLRPLALVLHSGGKSLHGWYPCNGEEEESAMNRFMRFAVSLGADEATWTRSQFVRMPDGVRDNGKRQRVLYFNPGVLNGGAK